ncbi:hypothetical protein [Deinococcus depolymerans]|uniref:Uncharacterized protein n=1 Tax=Deinococcus depolymerans TaxID=392408 RepID=A0ABN1CJC5_9DEIO
MNAAFPADLLDAPERDDLLIGEPAPRPLPGDPPLPCLPTRTDSLTGPVRPGEVTTPGGREPGSGLGADPPVQSGRDRETGGHSIRPEVLARARRWATFYPTGDVLIDPHGQVAPQPRDQMRLSVHLYAVTRRHLDGIRLDEGAMMARMRTLAELEGAPRAPLSPVDVLLSRLG